MDDEDEQPAVGVDHGAGHRVSRSGCRSWRGPARPPHGCPWPGTGRPGCRSARPRAAARRCPAAPGPSRRPRAGSTSDSTRGGMAWPEVSPLVSLSVTPVRSTPWACDRRPARRRRPRRRSPRSPPCTAAWRARPSVRALSLSSRASARRSPTGRRLDPPELGGAGRGPRSTRCLAGQGRRRRPPWPARRRTPHRWRPRGRAGPGWYGHGALPREAEHRHPAGEPGVDVGPAPARRPPRPRWRRWCPGAAVTLVRARRLQGRGDLAGQVAEPGAALDGRRAALALGEHGVATGHEHDLGRAGALHHGRGQGGQRVEGGADRERGEQLGGRGRDPRAGRRPW